MYEVFIFSFSVKWHLSDVFNLILIRLSHISGFLALEIMYFVWDALSMKNSILFLSFLGPDKFQWLRMHIGIIRVKVNKKKNTCTSKNWKIKGKLKFLKLAVIFLEDPPLKKFAGIMLFLTSILTKGQMISSASVECIHW